MNPDEEFKAFINGLKTVREYCKKTNCITCIMLDKYNILTNYCMLKNSPANYDLRKLKPVLKKVLGKEI